jgi:hypothetical protein
VLLYGVSDVTMPRLWPACQALARVFLPMTALLGAGCAAIDPPEGPPRRETVWVVTAGAELLALNAGQPSRPLQRRALQGLAAGEQLVGIDFRVARGVLYALSDRGRLFTVDTASGRLTPVGAGPAVPLAGERFGVDFNPAADRIRVVSDRGQNLRLHPDTGAVAATDPALAWQAADGGRFRVAAAAYTYNPHNDKLTTNYAIDLAQGRLLTQGSVEGRTPVVSPNTGRLSVVGALGTGPLEAASLDIADIDNTTLAALRHQGRTRLYLVDLERGGARLLGTVADGGALWGLAIEP